VMWVNECSPSLSRPDGKSAFLSLIGPLILHAHPARACVPGISRNYPDGARIRLVCVPFMNSAFCCSPGHIFRSPRRAAGVACRGPFTQHRDLPEKHAKRTALRESPKGRKKRRGLLPAPIRPPLPHINRYCTKCVRLRKLSYELASG
jgi:hypothetical protein